jgi:hypothetical protein
MTEIQPRICKLDFSTWENKTDLENNEQYFKCEFDANQYGGYTIDYIAEDHFGIKQITINNCHGDGILAKVCYDENVYNLDIHQYIANKVSDALHPWLDYKHAISLDFENGLSIFQQSSSRYLSWLVRHVDARNKYDNRILYQLYYGDGAIRNQIQGYDITSFKPVEHSWYCLLKNVKTYEGDL